MANDTATNQTTETTEYETNIRQGLDVIQSMIDISADRLEALRTQCATSAELTQLEIRTLETKLVKMFSELLITKAKLSERLPKGLSATGAELKQWLRIVGLSPDSLNAVMQRVNTLEILLDTNEGEIRCMLNQNVNIREEEVRRLLRAMFNLKRCREAITGGNNEPNELFWDSWDRHHHIHHTAGASPRAHRSTSRYQQHQQYNRMINNTAVTTMGDNSLMQTVDLTIKDGNDTVDKQKHLISPEDTSASTLTPSPSPPNSPCVSLNAKGGHKRGFTSTPPARKKHQTVLTLNQQMQQANSYSHVQYQQQFTPPPMGSMCSQTAPINSTEQNSIIKSRSQESQWTSGQETLGKSIVTTSNIMSTAAVASNIPNPVNQFLNGGSSVTTSTSLTSTTTSAVANMPTPRSRLYTEPSPENYNDIVENISNLNAPRSPCTPIVTRGMGHMIAHRFTKKFKVMSTCDLCNKQMFFGLKCKECKYRCHKDCESNVPPSCGLPPEFIDEFKRSLPSDVFLPNTSPNLGKTGNFLLSSGRRDRHKSQAFANQYIGGPDSSSAGSSCNSSSPSSPALLTIPPQTPAASKQTQFHFPDLAAPTITYHKHHHHHHHHHQQHYQQYHQQHHQPEQPIMEMAKMDLPKIKTNEKPIPHRSNATRTQSSGLTDTTRSNGSDKTDKTVSLSGSISASTDSVRSDSTEERALGHWPRQNSLSLKEWDIPFGNLNLLEEIGRGRFGTVHRGLWHGDVAVKIFNEGYLDDEHALEAFKLEVGTFKKTRHENLVLFMGFCIKPQAIVTSLCKGNTLYTHIHVRRDKFNLYRAILVAQQISQGMGYLHAKEIIHKDLKTKNIFLENGKVIITDFGLFSTTKMKYTSAGLFIEENGLCYLAPELIRQLRAVRPAQENLPFSKASDVYAFGTIWYELLCGEFPFKGHPVEYTIFQIGRGMKYTLANVQASRDVKDILMLCSAFQSDDRPDFAQLVSLLLERLPKKRLARSPSHPVQLSRSAESVF